MSPKRFYGFYSSAFKALSASIIEPSIHNGDSVGNCHGDLNRISVIYGAHPCIRPDVTFYQCQHWLLCYISVYLD
jgi:hypothetical protein